MDRHGFRAMNDFCRAAYLEERTFLRWMKNSDLKKRTEGKFDGGKFDGAHPVFILSEIGICTYRCCPCTSKRNSQASYIKKGAKPMPLGDRMDRDSFILHIFSFTVTGTDPLLRRLSVDGRIDENDIVGVFHKRGGR